MEIPKKRALWIAVVTTTVVSAAIAFLFAKHDAVREMATGAFGGAIVGWLILLYEEIREDERDVKQGLRDEKQASRIAHRSNMEADARGLADYLLKEYKPMRDKYFSHRAHNCPTIREVRHAIVPALGSIKYYVGRVSNNEIKVAHTEYLAAFNNRKNKPDKELKNNEVDLENRAMQKLLQASEDHLETIGLEEDSVQKPFS